MTSEALRILSTTLRGGGQGCPSLRARRAPGRSLPTPPLPREQDGELDSQGPVRTGIRSNNIGECLQARVEGLAPDQKYLPQPSPERHRPFVSVFPFPVGRDDRRAGEIPTLVKIVVDGILREELAHI